MRQSSHNSPTISSSHPTQIDGCDNGNKLEIEQFLFNLNENDDTEDQNHSELERYFEKGASKSVVKAVDEMP